VKHREREQTDLKSINVVYVMELSRAMAIL
jgi:hypothetical protein